MKGVKIISFIIFIISLSLYGIENINMQMITGKVVYVNGNDVQIEVPKSRGMHIGNKVNLYYKTSFGNKIKVGTWSIISVKNKTVNAKPVSVSDIPTVGLLADIIIFPKNERTEVMRDNQNNTDSTRENSDAEDIAENTAVNSQLYVDKARQIADDMRKNAKNYSEQKIKRIFNEYMNNVQKAVLLDNAEGYYMLALIYEDGYGDFKRDLRKSIDNLIKAGERGYVEAQFILGDMYEDGDEVVKDEERAIYWYKKAVQQGHKKAKKALEKLLKKQEGEIPLQIRGKEPKNFGIPDMNDLFDLGK